MIQKEFYRASLRHLSSCKALLEKISTCASCDKSAYILEVCYLSGYIIETILSWAIFEQANYKGDILKSEIYNDSFFKTHCLMSKSNIALKKYGCNLRGVIFIDQKHADKNLQNMYSKWTVDLRYQNYKDIHKDLSIDENAINIYLKEVENVMNLIIKKYH